MRYEKPFYERENIEASDVILASGGITNAGEGTLGSVSGEKGVAEFLFDSIF